MEPLFSGLQTLFIGLLDYTIDVSIMIGLIFIIRSVTRRKLPAWWYYSLWLILLIRMLIPLEFEKLSNLFNFVPVLAENSLFELSGITINASASGEGWNLQVDQALLFLWFIGVIVLGIYIFYKNMNFWNIIKKKPLLTDKKVLDLLEECKSRMKINTVLGVIITDKVKSPALFGYIRPRLLLPEGILEKLNDAELAYVFMHELGHLKRHDIGISWLLTIMQIIHWFNPLVWLAFYQMRVDQESACDASVLSRIKHNQYADYANAIIGFLEKFCQNRQLPALAGILESKSQMKRRIAMITFYKRFSRRMTFVAFALLISIGFISFTISGLAEVKQGQTGDGVDTGRVYELSEVDEPPRVLYSFPPEYPYNAKRSNISGEVILQFIVTKEGTVRDAIVFESEPAGVFDQSTLDAVYRYRFQPGTKDGQAVDVTVKMPIVFRMGPE
ncbi:TonB family protein [Deltaproteobacteria bacterium]|nr:TonB family protein [Deltaproteobacteria bacterium]